MIDAVSIATDGYIHKDFRSLAIATNGYISLFILAVIPIKRKKGGLSIKKQRKEEDEDILIIIHIFMVLWDSKIL